MFEKVASLTRSRKNSSPKSDSSSRSTLTKRPYASPMSPVSPTSSSNGASSLSNPGDHGSIPDDASKTPQSIAPQVDAPRGAGNSEGRTVSVRCRGVAVKVPVSNDTTAEDVLEACREEMEGIGQPISLDTSVILEPCAQPGLERRIRRYELIRDVMSSWDGDSQNTLIVLTDSSDPDKELSLGSVPKTSKAPAGFVLSLYHSQRPGKWSKRYITLSESGQMLASKKPQKKPSDKDVVRLCHLSDYDFYLPTESETKKQLKPPKRYCYAIKSQHRRSIFVSSDNYVHFFCTDDPELARQFRTAVHHWRSWYLVNTKLQLHKKERQPTAGHSAGNFVYGGKASVDLPSSRKSFDSPRYRVGDVDTHRPKQPEVPPVPLLPVSPAEEKAATFASNGLLGEEYDKRKQDAQRNENALRQRDRALSGADGKPFAEGPSLLNRAGFTSPISPTDGRPQTARPDRIGTTSGCNSPESPTWTPPALAEYAAARERAAGPAVPLSQRPSTASQALSRAVSVRSRVPRSQQQQEQQQHPPLPQASPPSQPARGRAPTAGSPPPAVEPLIDLTPKFVEAPQFSREGRGRGVRAPQGTPLVELATGPSMASGAAARLRGLETPPQRPLRRGEVGGGGGGIGGKGTLMEQYETKRQEMMQMQQMQGGGGRRRRSGGASGAAGLDRTATVRSNASGAINGGGGSGGAGAGLVAAYTQSTRGLVMGSGEAERVRDGADGGRAGYGRWKQC